MEPVRKTPNWLMPCRTSKHWKRLRMLVHTLYKTKKTLNMLIEILHRQKTHITFQLDHLAMDKTEYFDINDLLHTLTEKIITFRKQVATQGLLIFNQPAYRHTCETLTEIYIQVLYVIEKYGLTDIPTVINIYLLTYVNLMDIYELYCQPNNSQCKPPTTTTLANTLSTNSTNSTNNILSDSPDIFTSPYDSENTSGAENDSDESQFDISEHSPVTPIDTQKQPIPCNQKPNFQAIFTTLSKKMDDLVHHRNSNSRLELSKFVTDRVFCSLTSVRLSSHAASSEYLSVTSATCIPFQVNAFVQLLDVSGSTMHDLYQNLGMFSTIGLISNTRILATNERISNIYRDLLISKFGYLHAINSSTQVTGANIYTCDIKNKLILNTLPEMTEAAHNRVIHVLIRIPISRNANILFVLNCYFVNDDNLIVYKYPLLSRKLETIKQQIGCLTDITAGFKSNIANIITLKQCLCDCPPDILQWCYTKWELYQVVMAKPLIECMNYFLTQSKDRKADILTALLLNYTVPDSSYRAFILWDLLVDESINLTGNPGLEHGIFMLIKPELQTHLKHILDIQYERTRQITTINENDLEYERKIMLSLADDNTKARALEKLREVSNKASDNSSKAQKYLDGLLAIPFGKYSKEWIIVKNDQLYDTVRTCIGNLLAMCYEYQDIYTACGELANWLISELGLPAIPAGHDTARLEPLINQYMTNSKCGAYQLNRILDYINKLVSSRVVISKDHLDYTYVRTILESLDTITQNDTLNTILVDIQSSIPVKHTRTSNILFLLDDYIKGPYKLDVMSSIIHVLTEDNHFYDIGYPPALLNYQNRLAELLTAWDNLKTEKRKFLDDSYARLDASIYGQAEAKDQLIRIIAQWINGNQSGYCLGFEGSPGLGKTSLAKYGISQALADKDGKSRPFGFIALGGSSNGSILEGHGYTYVGSTWGRIADILMQSKCMNPIIFVDELDKISTTENGRELIGILTHLTDRTQNNEFMDKYFDGVRLDLSKVLFIFSYNDYDRLDSILADRIHRIRFENYTIDDKVVIARDYLVPKIRDEINILGVNYVITPDTIRYLVDAYTYEAGVRKLKEKLYDLYRELNVRDIRGSQSITDGQINITPGMVDDVLSSYHKVEHDMPYSEPRVGIVYGLFATGMGIGGITIIQVARKRVDSSASLICTGKQGEVMMESMKVALTLACNLVPHRNLVEFGICDAKSDELCKSCTKNAIQPVTDKYAFHIHCPDGATPKDGPSAGCAFTLGLVSQLTKIPVRNDVSMTGEVDIMGNVLPIGGLDSKILGSKRAGIRHVLVPEKNRKDIERIRMKTPSILDEMTITYISVIDTVLELGLTQKINAM